MIFEIADWILYYSAGIATAIGALIGVHMLTKNYTSNVVILK